MLTRLCVYLRRRHNLSSVFRSQAGVSQRPGGGIAAAKEIVSEEGVQGLYTGYASNVAYAFPADAVKFLVRVLNDIKTHVGLGVMMN